MFESNYDQLVSDMDESYGQWQTDAYPLAKEYRKAKQAANAQAVLGTLGILAAAAAGANSNSTAGQSAAIAGAVASAALLANSFRKRAESSAQAAQLNELGNSVQRVLAPQVIDLEGKQIELQGSASEQLSQWRGLLTELFMDTQVDFEAIEIIKAES